MGALVNSSLTENFKIEMFLQRKLTHIPYKCIYFIRFYTLIIHMLAYSYLQTNEFLYIYVYTDVHMVEYMHKVK